MERISKLVPLRKSRTEPSKLRPILLASIWYVVVSKFYAFTTAPIAAELFCPSQMAVGVQGALEIVITKIRAMAEIQGKAILKLDAKNGYNSINLNAVLRYLKKTPRLFHLIPIFLNRYGKGGRCTILRDSQCASKKYKFDISGGLEQGDPLAPIYFCCAIADALEEFVSNEKYKHSVAYLDDLIVACDLDDVVAAQTRWQALLDKHETGLQI